MYLLINLIFSIIKGIPDELCRRAGITATWRTGNKLGIFAHKHVNAYSGGT